MSSLFVASDRTNVDVNGVFQLNSVIVAYALNRYFEPEALAADGVALIRVTSSKNIGLANGETGKVIEETEIRASDHSLIYVFSNGPSKKSGDTRLRLDFEDVAGAQLWSVEAKFASIQIDLLADFDRDGSVDHKHPGRSDWNWGKDGLGAILLVNSDRDTAYPNPRFRDRLDDQVNGPLDLEDMTRLSLVVQGPPNLDLVDYSIRLHVSDAAASRIRIFDVSQVLAKTVIGPGIPIVDLSPRIGVREFAAEGLDYPDAAFNGLISIGVELERNNESFGGDKCVLRVAPWLALPNTQPAQRLYIAEMRDGSNANAIRDIKALASEAGIPLVLVDPKVNKDDRWLQDEVEIGYASRPGKSIPVVLDSPRNRGLDRFPETMLLGPDFGYVTRGNDGEAGSLDSFGNLDCTPPHTGPKGDYPFGRIVFGGAHPAGGPGRRMMKVVSDFVYAQQVQHPIELYSDWLTVGHVDEFMTFVPAADAKGFRLVLASPKRAISILSKLSAEGNGSALLMANKRHEGSVDDLLSNSKLIEQNKGYQKIIDWNRSVLIKEMGLGPGMIVEIPALYFADGSRAGAYFPGMVNMQVINNYLAIPKPFGPDLNGVCAFEAFVISALSPLGLQCRFIDTYEGYHLAMGEIHCGTNVVRSPFGSGWWQFNPQVNQNHIVERVI
jgi:protein-arginine deiminase